MTDEVWTPAMRVTVFHRPNARKEDVTVSVDEQTAIDAAQLLETIERGRFTYENCGPFVSLCLEGVVDAGEGPELQDIIMKMNEVAPVDHCDWAGFVAECKRKIVEVAS